MKYSHSPTLKQISIELGIPVTNIAKLDTGENPFMESIVDKKTILTKTDLYLYPDPLCTDVRTKLSKYTGFSFGWIMCGNGSDELIDLIIRAFVVPKDEEVIICPPTFPMYKIFGNISRIKIISVPRQPNLYIDINNIKRSINSKTKVIFIDSPGNPSGNIVSPADVKELLKQNVLVVIDEAYFEYGKQTVLPLIRKYPNLIVLRSLSKWAGLAGLRIGYMIANPKIIDSINSIKPPYNVNSIAQMVALDVLKKRKVYLSRLNEVISLRKKLVISLRTIPSIKVFPTRSAYVVFQTKQSAKVLQESLKQNGVLVKVIDQPLMRNSIRVSLGKQVDIQKLLKLLRVCVIFDIDGTLINVSKSYREAIRLTASYFLDRVVTKQEVDQIKSRPGYNNDWDATFALVSHLPNPPLFKTVKDRFQEYYLGTSTKLGLINTERLLVKKQLLKKLGEKYTLGIVTGRPRAEAEIVLNRFNIRKLFKEVVCMEDTPNGKPDPSSLLLCQQKLKAKDCVYIGDSPNDILAAKSAKMRYIAVNFKNDINQVISRL